MTYKCSICGLHYEKKEVAQECYRWCSAHSSCNLKVGRQSLEAQRKNGAK